MRKFTLSTLLLTLTVTGCISAEEQMQRDQASCSAFGFSPGSDAFAQCVMQTANRREDNNRAELERYRRDASDREWQKLARERAKAAQ